MTKRSSPYENEFCRQLKVHVNNYENDLAALKASEERTIKILINGSRNLNSLKTPEKICSPIIVDNHDRGKNFIQKSVTNYFTVNGKISNKKIDRLTGSDDVSRCFYCDQKTYHMFQCVKCSEYYCGACSFAKYESFEERRICLSCS